MIELTDPFSGKTYPSLTAAAKAIGISHAALRYRLNHYSPELIFYPERIQGVFSKDPEGREFKSIADMARAWKADPRLVRDRLRRNWSIKQALCGKEKK